MIKKCFLIYLSFLTFSALYSSEASAGAYTTPLNNDQFESFIQKADKPVIIDFWATWCPPCMQMKPIFEQLANELHDQYVFVTVDMDQGKQIAKKYNVQGLPTFMIIKNNAVLGSFMGYTDKETFKRNIDNLINNKITQERLMSAIQTDDKDLVATCLKNKEINVNAITKIEVVGIPTQMTPLLMAVSKVLFGESPNDIVALLLKAGAQPDLEFDSPNFDKSGTVSGWSKITARSLVEEFAKGKSDAELAGLKDSMRPIIIENTKKAASLLALFNQQKQAI